GGPAGRDPRAVVLIRVLCAARSKDAAALRGGARESDGGARRALRVSAAAGHRGGHSLTAPARAAARGRGVAPRRDRPDGIGGHGPGGWGPAAAPRPGPR